LGDSAGEASRCKALLKISMSAPIEAVWNWLCSWVLSFCPQSYSPNLLLVGGKWGREQF